MTENKSLRDPQRIVPVVDGEVLVSWAKDPKFSLDGVPDSTWETVGILDESSRVEFNRTVEKNKTSGMGYGVVAVSTKPGELTAAATTLEDNEATRKIAWPETKEGEGITVDGKAEILYHSEKISKPFVSLVQTNDNGEVTIQASRYPAYATMEDLGFGTEVTGKTINFDFISGRNKDAFDRLIITKDGDKVANNDKIIRFDKNASQPESPDTENPGAGA